MIIAFVWYTSSLHVIILQHKIPLCAGEIILSDIIDSDSWRLWRSGDPRLKLSKQVYRDAQNVTGELLQQVKLNFQWVSDKAEVRHSWSVVYLQDLVAKIV